MLGKEKANNTPDCVPAVLKHIWALTVILKHWLSDTKNGKVASLRLGKGR